MRRKDQCRELSIKADLAVPVFVWNVERVPMCLQGAGLAVLKLLWNLCESSQVISMLPRPSIKQTNESETWDLLECARRFYTSLPSTRLYPLIFEIFWRFSDCVSEPCQSICYSKMGQPVCSASQCKPSSCCSLGCSLPRAIAQQW